MEEVKRFRSKSGSGRTAETSKTIEVMSQSKKILALLLSRLGNAEPTVTYAEVAKAIGIHVCNLKHPMDHLSRTLISYAASHQGLQIPPLQLLIVNSKSRLPGPGASAYILPPFVNKDEQYSAANPARQREIASAIYTAISQFSDWQQVGADVASLL